MPARSRLGGLSKPLLTLDVPHPDPEIAERNTDLIEDCRYIGSYDWAPGSSKKNPAIVVPGSPNVWSNPRFPLKVAPDRGKSFRDRNGHILPGRPLLPLVAAVNEQLIFPPEDWKAVDFVTDRNGLRKLLRWINAASGRDFRIDTQLVGEKTVVLNRWEPSTTEHMNGHSYGFNFEKAVTIPMSPATQRSIGHHRVVTYKFGRSRLVVQFEVDGCLSQNQPAASTSEGNDEELINAIASMGLSSQGASSTPALTSSRQPRQGSSAFGLNIHHRGNANIPHSSILEVQTLSSGKGAKWVEHYPQLYFSQTGNHFLGRHTNGQFPQIEKVTLSSPQFQGVNAKLQPALKKLEEALRQIQSIVVQHGKTERLSLVYEKPNLTIHKRLDDSSCLPATALALFD